MIDCAVKVVQSKSTGKIRDQPLDVFDTSSSLLESLFGDRRAVELFFRDSFRRSPCVYRGRDLRLLSEQLHDLDLLSLLENSASDKIHVWLSHSGGSSAMESIMVDDPAQAAKLHAVGHSLYCRLPSAVEAVVVPRIATELGLGPIGADNDRYRRGEIETFYSRRGHVTEFHTDFQENITIHLTGRKRWTFARSSAVAPIRGCTPHFSSKRTPEVVEQQMKVLQLGDPNFSRKQFADGIISSDGRGSTTAKREPTSGNSGASIGQSSKKRKLDDTREQDQLCSVELDPGDVMYHPAGVWHRVECLEDSIAINISITAASYAEVFCSGLQQLLMQSSSWRSPVSVLSGVDLAGKKSATETLQEMLDSLPILLKVLTPADFLPLSCYPSIRKELNRSIENDNDTTEVNSESSSASEEASSAASGQEIETETGRGMNVLAPIIVEDLEVNDATLVSDKGKDCVASQSDVKTSYVFNPFAVILSPDSLVDSVDNGASGASHRRYVVHCSFGNESLESLIRQELVVGSSLYPAIDFIHSLFLRERQTLQNHFQKGAASSHFESKTFSLQEVLAIYKTESAAKGQTKSKSNGKDSAADEIHNVRRLLLALRLAGAIRETSS